MPSYFGNSILDTVVLGRTAAYVCTHSKYDINYWLAWHLKSEIIWQFFSVAFWSCIHATIELNCL